MRSVSKVNPHNLPASFFYISVMEALIFPMIYLALTIAGIIIARRRFKKRRIARRDTYREYLKTEEWQRKRYVVLKRDNWTCQHCGVPATQVHHLKYAKYNIGKEPIKWLVSLCKRCHEKQH